MCVSPSLPIQAYLNVYHIQLIELVFSREPKAGRFADKTAAILAALKVDDLITNDDANQYRHAMRSRGTTLQNAYSNTDKYIADELNSAVRSATANPPDKREAGRHLGLMLHAIQDKKHNWISCNQTSNPNSNDSCSVNGGCAAPGAGNHGMGLNCEVLYSTNSLANFQNKTDTQPWLDQRSWDLAFEQSYQFLELFVSRIP